MKISSSIYQRIAIFVIGISLMAPMLYSMQFYAERMLHRMEMWQDAKDGLLQTIELDSAGIQWTKKNRELIINGEYFDIVSITYKKGKAEVKGVFDHKETEMHNAFAETQENDTKKGHATRHLADWLQTCWVWNEIHVKIAEIKLQDAVENGIIPFLHPSVNVGPATPPPWQYPA